MNGPHPRIDALAAAMQRGSRPHAASEMICRRRLGAHRDCPSRAENRLAKHFAYDRWMKAAARPRRATRRLRRQPANVLCLNGI